MDRRALLQGLLALPVASALDGIKYVHAQAPSSAVTLRVVLDGAFAIVLQADSRWNLRIFTPIDTAGMHEFRVFGSQLAHTCKDGEITSSTQRYNFTLLPEGLKPSSSRPTIDSCLRDFNVATDLWCQSRYFVTIDLPAPRNITFLPPLSTVVFKNRDDGSKYERKEGCMPSNHVLEYDVTDATKIKMAWQQMKKDVEFRPITNEELWERYRKGCDEMRGDHSKDREGMPMPPQCSDSGIREMRERFSLFKSGDLTFFFGVGLPRGSRDTAHPVQFFNDRILESFPNLRDRLAIASIGGPSPACNNKLCKPGDVPGASLLGPATPQGHLMNVSSVIDCHVSGPVVTFQG
jgi:hypothetical protein